MADGTSSLLLDQGPDAIVFADKRGVIREWNDAATRVFGFSRDEAIGKTLDIIVPERFRETHWQGYDRALAAGDTKYRGQSMPTRSARKDGTSIYVELSFAIIHDESGEVIGALAHARDITERFAREREQRQRIQELEQKLAATAEPAS